MHALAPTQVWNLRSKTPSTALTTVPWHQDIAYLCPGAEATPQPTAWIPLLDGAYYKTPFFGVILVSKTASVSICQDRLGTGLGKVEENGAVFLQ